MKYIQLKHKWEEIGDPVKWYRCNECGTSLYQIEQKYIDIFSKNGAAYVACNKEKESGHVWKRIGSIYFCKRCGFKFYEKYGSYKGHEFFLHDDIEFMTCNDIIIKDVLE